MKRNFNTLMKCIGVVAGCATIFACTEINELEERVDSLDNRITALETQLPALNQSIDAINKIIQDGSVITSLEYIVPEDENQEPYYEFTLSNDSQTYRLVNGSVGNIPTIGINENGNWTLTTEDGNTTEILVNGEPASAKAIVPEFEIDSEGYWTISTDDGENFTRVLDSEGQPVRATGTEGSDIFDNVEYVEAEGVLRITMAGSDTPIEVRVISAEEFSCIIMYNGAEVDYDTPIEFGLGNVMNFNVSMTGVVTSIISKPEGWSAVLGDPANGTAVLTVTAPATMTPVTRISASTENDITIHAINEEGLSIFAKMQVKLLPGEKPSISVSAVDANSYTSVSFNLADAQDMTSYKYLLYNADSPAPTEASFANATEVTSENPVTPLVLTETSDGTTVLYNESYTLYVMPVNTTTEGYVINGDIEQATASTLTADTYSDLYNAGVPITIGGKTYSRELYGEATIIEADTEITALEDNQGVYFINPDATLTYNYQSAVYKLILIGNDPDQKSTVVSKFAIRSNPSSNTDGELLMYNIDFDATELGTYSIVQYNDMSSTVRVIDSKIQLGTYPFIAITTDGRYYNDIELEGNVIRLTGNANFINLGSNTAEQPNISFVDNIFYAADGAVSNYRLFAGNSATINDLTLQNNTFVNVYTTGGMFNYGTLEQVVISNNLIYMQNQAANMYIFRPSSSTQQGVSYEGTYPGNPETGICDDNIVYDAAQGTFNKQWFYGGMNRVVLDPESEMTVITENPFSELDIPNERFVTSSTYSSYGAQQ